MHRSRALIVGLAIVASFVLSCGDDGPNMLPDTNLITAPPQGETSSYLVEMAWEGEDPDGRIAAFEIAWHDGITYSGTLDSLSWDRVTVEDSTFAVSADTCPQVGNSCEGSHTFFVRAIDDDGGVDPTPATVSFNATTLIPHARIIYPPRSTGQFSVNLPTCVKVGWEGIDDDGEAVEYRYTVKPYEELPVHQPPEQWSKSWSPWSTATQAVITLQPLAEGDPWSFYVQARDNAGAIENVFQDTRNHILIYIDQGLNSRPYASICATRGACSSGGTSVGCRSTANPSQMNVPISVEVGDTLCFHADFAPGTYAKEVTDLAFAVNDSEEPGSWEDAADDDNLTWPPGGVHIVTPDMNYIYLWVRDDYCEYGSTAMVYIIINGQ